MYTEPKIVDTGNIKKRAYVSTVINGTRERFYSGNRLPGNPSIFPNNETKPKERARVLRTLLFELITALRTGWIPVPEEVKKAEEAQKKTVEEALQLALDIRKGEHLASKWIGELTTTRTKFLAFLTPKERSGSLNDITLERISKFLEQFNSSTCYYMNRRRQLSSLFSALPAGMLKENLVKQTKRKKVASVLHVAYDPDQIVPLFNYLEGKNKNLRMACMITYGCLLRPHREVRLLKRSHIAQDLSFIRLSGDENKGKRVRVVPVPGYVQDVFREMGVEQLEHDDNIFSRCPTPFNDDYFTTAWGDLTQDMRTRKLIRDKQTIYSFRHAAAIAVYRMNKDIHLLQQLMGHTAMTTTLTYLRGLGIVTREELISSMPALPQ